MVEAFQSHPAGNNILNQNDSPPLTLGQESFSSGIVTKIAEVERQRHAQVHRPISFGEFLDRVYRQPQKYLRNPGRYTADAIESWGWHEADILGYPNIRVFHAMKWPWQAHDLQEKRELIGMEIPFFRFWEHCRHVGNLVRPDRMVLFVGPPGSGKTTLAETIDALLEDYSMNNPEGQLLTFRWKFPRQGVTKLLGFTPERLQDTVDGEMSADDGHVRIAPSLHTNPFFLIPHDRRAEGRNGASHREIACRMLRTHAAGRFNLDYVLSGCLDSTSQTILDALMQHYRGDFERIVKDHVEILPWTMTCKLNRGLTMLQPSHAHGSGAEKRYQEHPLYGEPVPEHLRAVVDDLMNVRGIIPRTDGGHVHFEDMLFERQHLAGFGWLLALVERGRLQIPAQGGTELRDEFVNVLVRGDTNPGDLARVAGHPTFASWQPRCLVIEVPLILRFQSEVQALRATAYKALTHRRGKNAIEDVMAEDEPHPMAEKEHLPIGPHALEILALYLVSTRLLKPSSAHYSAIDKELVEVLERIKLCPVEKALLYQEGTPDWELNVLRERGGEKEISSRDLNLLRKNLKHIVLEHAAHASGMITPHAEGFIGLSLREGKALLRDIVFSRVKRGLSVVDVVDFLMTQLDRHIDRMKSVFIEGKLAEARQASNAAALRRESLEREAQEFAENHYHKPVVKDIETYARHRVLRDIDQALGLVKEEDTNFAVMRYVYNVIALASKGHTVVPREYRSERMRADGAGDEAWLKEFEDRFFSNLVDEVRGALSRANVRREARDEFRAKVSSRLGAWASKHPGEKPETHLASIFPELIESVSRSQKNGQSDIRRDFLERTRRYAEHPEQAAQDAAIALQGVAVSRYLEARKKLIEAGYPEQTIATHVEWALGPLVQTKR